MGKVKGKHRRRAPDRADAALEAHRAAAATMGLCPRLHPLGPDGTCRECTGPLEAIDLPRRGRHGDGDGGRPVLAG